MMNAYKEILVIDNEPGGRALINNELKAAGFHTVLAQNSAEALVALLEKQDIDLVLLDVRLPVINGLNIFEIIRKNFPNKKILINGVLQKDEKRFFIHDTDNDSQRFQNLSTLKEKIDNARKNNRLKETANLSDKRIFKRMPINVLATCERQESQFLSSYVYFHSCTKDLSQSGGRFIVDKDIKVGQHFMIALKLPVNAIPFLIECEVVWTKESEVLKAEIKEGVEAGVRFVKLDSPHDEEKLKRYLN